MNKTILQGRWRRMRGNLKAEWAKLTDNDRRMLEGRVDQMVGMLQERYGHTQEQATKTLSHYMKAYGRSRRQPTAPALETGRPLLALFGLMSMVAGLWFVYQRFMATPAKAEQQEYMGEEGITSPEALLG